MIKYLCNAINIANDHVMQVSVYNKYRYTLKCNLINNTPSNLKMTEIIIGTETIPRKKSDMLSTANSKFALVVLFSE